MFQRNTGYEQRELFDDVLSSLPATKQQAALTSPEYTFYEEVFCRLDEKLFAPLFPQHRGRPNAPVNCLVGALILREQHSWTYEELFRHLDFDLLTRLALGLTGLSETPFCPATLFNFQQRLVRHEQETGCNLFEKLFHALTGEQLQRHRIDPRIQRTDSFRAMSNIANYGRVRLLLEVLWRLHRVLAPTDQQACQACLEPYLAQTAEHYVYRLEDAALPRELAQLAELYVQLQAALGDRYAERSEYQHFARVLTEQFEVRDDGGVRVRERQELGSDTLQSPDDPEATYNAKRGKPQKGHKVNVVETATPENEFNLITEVSVTPNNVSDGMMLAERLDTLKEQTPALNELHSDGGYEEHQLGAKMDEHHVLHVLTGTRMGHAQVNMQYAVTADGGYTVTCPCQTVMAEPTRKRWKAVFADAVCRTCPHAAKCGSIQHPGKRTFYFEEQWAQTYLRSRNLELIPEERRTLRANVEATVKEFTRCFNHKGKLRVRGLAATWRQMLAAALAINCGRIHRYRTRGPAATSSATPAVPQALFAALTTTFRRPSGCGHPFGLVLRPRFAVRVA